MSSYDDGLPNEAFTDLERAAGVPNLMRGGAGWQRRKKLDPSTLTDSGSSFTKEEFTERLLKEICEGEGWSRCCVVPHECDPRAHYSKYAVSGLQYGDEWLHFFSFQLDDGYASTKFVMDVLRETGLPMYDDEGTTICWDTKFECLDFDQRPNVREMRKHSKDEMPQGAEQRLLYSLLRRAWMTTDHGFKPLLVRSENLAKATRGEVVPFIAEESSALDDYEDYHLVYFTSRGAVRSVPFNDATKMGVLICTRNGGYCVRDRKVFATMTHSAMLSDAFQLAVKCNPNEFGRYERRKEGTVFQAQFTNLGSPPFKLGADTRDGSEALRNCEAVTANDSIDLQVFFTDGPHPLEARLVTTPALYEQAVRRLRSFGYTIGYSMYASGVKVLRQR